MPLFKLFVTILNIPRIIPSFILFCLKINDCEDDVKQALIHRDFNSNVFIGFCYLMVFDKTFRNIFYKRIGKLKYFVYYFILTPIFFLTHDYTFRIQPGNGTCHLAQFHRSAQPVLSHPFRRWKVCLCRQRNE